MQTIIQLSLDTLEVELSTTIDSMKAKILTNGVSFFTSILSISNMHPPMVWPIMSPCTMQSGTFYNFALDEPYALSLVDIHI